MKKAAIILSIFTIFIMSCNHSVSEKPTVFLQDCEEKDYRKLPEIASVDLTKLLIKNAPYTGMIGDDIQKMEVVFLSITRINEMEYKIIGKSKVKNNICDFEGVIEVQNVIESDIAKSEIADVDGKVIGKYRFYENKNQPHTGIFEGAFETYWAYDDDGIVVSSDFWYTASAYAIIFSGTWKSYQTENIKNACWSDYKGCFPSGFNRSDGPDLIPNEEYRSRGWFEADMFSSDEEKRAIAKKEWRENWLDWWK